MATLYACLHGLSIHARVFRCLFKKKKKINPIENNMFCQYSLYLEAHLKNNTTLHQRKNVFSPVVPFYRIGVSKAPPHTCTG